MASIPMFQTGQHMVAMTVDTVSVSATGSLTDDASVTTLTAEITDIGIVASAVLEEISAMNADYRNNVWLIDDISYTITILKLNDDVDPNPLYAKWLTKKYFKLVWTEGTGSGATTHTAYVIRQDFSEGMSGKGQQQATFTFAVIDAGASTYVRS